MSRQGFAQIREFFVWWRMELRDLLHAAAQLVPSRRSPKVLLRVSGDSIAIEQRQGEEWRPLATVDTTPTTPPALPPELQGARASLVFEDGEFFFDDFELPIAAERHLASALRLQLERSLPLPLTELLSDHQVMSTDKKRGVIRVRVAVAHRERIEQLRHCATALGFEPVSAGPAAGSPALNLLRRRRESVRWRPSPLDLRLVKLAGITALTLAAAIGGQWVHERMQVEHHVERLHAQADKLRQLRARLHAQTAPLLMLRELRRAGGAPELLATLSAALPPPAWFSHVVLTAPAQGAATLELTGEASSQELTSAALHKIRGIRNVQTSSAFSGELFGQQRVEFRAEYAPGAGVMP